MKNPRYKVTQSELTAVLTALETVARLRNYSNDTPVAVIRDYSNKYQTHPEEDRLITIPWQVGWGKMEDYKDKKYPENMPDEVCQALSGLCLDIGTVSWVVYYKAVKP